MSPPITRALRDLIAERDRQRQREGWSDDHDDMHEDGSLARMAACYALVATMNPETRAAHASIMAAAVDGMATVFHLVWPASIERGWFKPYTPRRDLIRAGALILAELERLDRAEKRGARQQMLLDG